MEQLLDDYQVVDKEDLYFNKGGDEISSRDIWPATKDVRMVVMGTAGRKAKEITVSVDDLVPSQPTVIKNKVQKFIDGSYEKLPDVIKIGDKYHIIDGHHRLASKTVSGEKNVKVNAYS